MRISDWSSDLCSSDLVRAIAETFGIDKKVVEQRLALGNLVPSARDLVRSGKRQMGWAQAMTVGSPASQERIVAEIDVNSAAHLDGSSVRVELTRGNIPVKIGRASCRERVCPYG